jgi:phage terminase large subunit-like protein
MNDLVSPAAVLAHCAPEFFESLTDSECTVLAFLWFLWLRPEQCIPDDGWAYFGFICGRGFGKTLAIASYINRRVEAGDATKIGLMAPTEDRVDEVQIQALIDTAPPWFKPVRHKGGLLWPNGAIAYAFTAEAPDGPRGAGGGELHLSWLTEIVAWQHTTRLEAFSNITTATRAGLGQVVWDTTSKGKNNVIQLLLRMHATDPVAFRLQRGEMFDNPQLTEQYIKTECTKTPPGTRKHDEEVRGRVFNESEGATWHQEWIDDNRRAAPPSNPVLRLVAIDPAISTKEGTDDTGLVVGSADTVGDAYVEKDLSGRLEPDRWCELAVDECASNGASGIVIERNRGGDVNIALIRVHAAKRGMVLVMLEGAEWKGKPFPRRKPGVIYVREMWAATSKQSRAVAPASYGKAGRVHHCGTFEETETELTTWEPGVGESPNRLDAHSYLVAELANLNSDETRERPATDVAVAAELHKQLKQRLGAISKQRRI